MTSIKGNFLLNIFNKKFHAWIYLNLKFQLFFPSIFRNDSIDRKKMWSIMKLFLFNLLMYIQNSWGKMLRCFCDVLQENEKLVRKRIAEGQKIVVEYKLLLLKKRGWRNSQLYPTVLTIVRVVRVNPFTWNIPLRSGSAGAHSKFRVCMSEKVSLRVILYMFDPVWRINENDQRGYSGAEQDWNKNINIFKYTSNDSIFFFFFNSVGNNFVVGKFT